MASMISEVSSTLLHSVILSEGQIQAPKQPSQAVGVCSLVALGACPTTCQLPNCYGILVHPRRLHPIIIHPDPRGILQCSSGASSVLPVPITTCEFIIPKLPSFFPPSFLFFFYPLIEIKNQNPSPKPQPKFSFVSY